MYDILFRPTAIGKLQLKNRIVMGPMGNLADPDGGFSERQIAYYAARAKGGTGLIVSGSLAFNPALCPKVKPMAFMEFAAAMVS